MYVLAGCPACRITGYIRIASISRLGQMVAVAYIPPYWMGKRNSACSQVKVIERATDLAKGFGAYVGVDLGGLAAAVAKEALNIAQIGSLL